MFKTATTAYCFIFAITSYNIRTFDIIQRFVYYLQAYILYITKTVSVHVRRNNVLRVLKTRIGIE